MTLKIYTAYDSCNGFLPSEALAVLDEPRHVRQGYYYAVAPTKKAALEYLPQAGIYMPRKTGDLRVATGNSVDALTEGGWLNQEGQIIVMGLNDRTVALWMVDHWERLGTLRYKDKTAGFGREFVPLHETT